MTPISTGIPIVGLGVPTPATPTTASRERPQEKLEDTAIATAFYPFARLSVTETRRQVEASAEFQEHQAVRREQRRAEERATLDQTNSVESSPTAEPDSTDVPLPSATGSPEAAVMPTPLSEDAAIDPNGEHHLDVLG